MRPEVLHHCLLFFHCEQLTIASGAAGGEVLHHHRLPGAHPHRLIGRTVTVHGPSIVSMHRCYNRTGSIFKILLGYTVHLLRDSDLIALVSFDLINEFARNHMIGFRHVVSAFRLSLA